MTQFDVYRNPSKASRDAYPYIVDIQTPVISEISTRIVIPLGRRDLFRDEMLQGLTPTITYEGDELLLLVPQIASVPSRILREPIGSLSHFRDEIIDALDFAITGV
jgi:toxin CcdB